jgi:sugar/nucleoside kinase (ribokinase family)
LTVKVLGLGTAAMDIVLRCESLPREDGFAFVHDEQLLPGGSCANVLVALANLGLEAGIVAKIGDDGYGQRFREDLSQRGVSTEYLFKKPGGTTLHTFVAVSPAGARSIFAHLGDSLLSLTAEEMLPEMLKGVKVFYTDMFPGKPALKLARLCRERGIRIVFNLECAPSFMRLCQVVDQELEEMLSLCDLFCAGREGLLELTAAGDYLDAVHALDKRYHPSLGLVATLGDAGANWWVDGERRIIAEAFPVQAVDTTGAGDAFLGGLISGFFFNNMTHQQALEFACACAATKCAQPGARLRANQSEVMNFLEKVRK